MPKLVKNATIEQDNWTILPQETTTIPAQNHIFIPLSVYLNNKAQFKKHTMAVYLTVEDDLTRLDDEVENIDTIGLFFNAFADGRHFSTARLLRDKYDFQGDIRALGHFIRDQLSYLGRCGFSSFSVDDDMSDDLTNSLKDFTEFYQASYDEPQPLFRRR